MTKIELPQFIKDLLSCPPKAGEGVHNWLYRLARVLHPYRRESEIEAILAAALATCGRLVSENEIRDAIANSKATAWSPGKSQSRLPSSTWPSLNEEQREAIVAGGDKLVDLWEASAIRLEGGASNTEWFIDQLFPGNPLLCVGRSSQTFTTQTREGWRGKLSEQTLIVPSPMLNRTGKTKDGRVSAHTLNNTGARRFLIIEFDSGTLDEQAALLCHLGERAPLVLAVFSGSKSLHGWFYCVGQPEDKLRSFMRGAVALGADRATWTRSQFVRMPDGMRDNCKRQSVYYFNHKGLK